MILPLKLTCVLWPGFGERDIENRVKCDADTSMLTSSISKPMVSCMLMKMLQHNLVSLDMDVRNYVEELPLKSYDGEEVCEVVVL